jgi:hypothetical protein
MGHSRTGHAWEIEALAIDLDSILHISTQWVIAKYCCDPKTTIFICTRTAVGLFYHLEGTDSTFPQSFGLHSEFLVNVDNLLHLIIATHKDTRSIMNMVWHDCEHSLHPAIHRLPSSYIVSALLFNQNRNGPTIFHYHGHGSTFVQDT